MKVAARRPVPRWLAVGLLLVAAAMLVAQGPGLQVEAWGSRLILPLQATVASAISGTLGTIATIQQARQLREQNVAYRDEIDRLQAEMVRLRELELENQDLRNLLGLRQQAPPGEMIAVRVVARDPLPFAQVLVVDGGSEQGVRED